MITFSRFNKWSKERLINYVFELEKENRKLQETLNDSFIENNRLRKGVKTTKSKKTW